jgi:hypothetical protein
MDKLELAERCEKATGPQRELDVAIAIECGPAAKRLESLMAGSPHNTVAEIAKEADRESPLVCIPSYTASLDAALTLVPEGWFVHSITEFNQRTWEVSLRGPDELRFAKGPEAWANSRTKGNERGVATPALALCAAALRARAEGGKS